MSCNILDVLGDRHAKSRSLNAGNGGGLLPRERLENRLEVLFTHADARILNVEFVEPAFVFIHRLLDDAHENLSA